MTSAWSYYRQALPPRRFFVMAAAFILVIDLVGLLLWLSVRHTADGELMFRILSPAVLLPVLACSVVTTVVGVRRISCFPLFTDNYRNWLQTTPWQADQPAPFGPWALILRDVWLCMITGMVTAGHLVLWYRILALDLTVVNSSLTGPLIAAAGFMLPTVILLATWLLFAIPIAAANWKGFGHVVLAWFGICASIASSFPLQTGILNAILVGPAIFCVHRRLKSLLTNLVSEQLTTGMAPDVSSSAAGEFQALSPRGFRPAGLAWLEARRRHLIPEVLILFLWITAFFWSEADERQLGTWWFAATFAVTLAILLRLLLMPGKLMPNQGLIGRWVSKTPIIAAYDRILWAPTLAFLAFLIPAITTWLGLLPSAITFPISTVLPYVLLIACGPDYQQWSLTCPVAYSLPLSMNHPGAKQPRKTSSRCS